MDLKSQYDLFTKPGEVLEPGTYTRTISPNELKGRTAKEVTVSTLLGERQTVLTSIKLDHENGQDLPWKTVVLIGGGASNAVGNSRMASLYIEGVADTKLGKDYNHRIIILPHVRSSARTTGHAETFQTQTLDLAKVLDNPELNPTEDMTILGFSAGGAQSMALAAEMGDRCKNLVLMDSAGLSNHPDLVKEFTTGSAIALLKKCFSDKSLNLGQKLKAFSTEMGNSWIRTRASAGSVLGILDDLLSGGTQAEVDTMAKAFGFDAKTASLGPDTKQVMQRLPQDTLEKITAKIVYSPVIFARVVNDVVDGLGWPSLLKEEPEKIALELSNYLRQLFPRSPQINTVLIPDTTHTSVMSEKKYWTNAFEPIVSAKSTAHS